MFSDVLFTEFQAVEAYLSHFDKHSETDTMLTYYSGCDMNADQKVSDCHFTFTYKITKRTKIMILIMNT